MFNTRSKSGFAEVASDSTTIIGSGTVIKGDIESRGDIRIDGSLIGNLTSGAKVLIGPQGSVEGNIDGRDADVLGKVSGKISVENMLQLRGNAEIKGDVYTGKLQVEPSVTFNGHCFMGANVVELKQDNSNVINQ